MCFLLSQTLPVPEGTIYGAKNNISVPGWWKCQWRGVGNPSLSQFLIILRSSFWSQAQNTDGVVLTWAHYRLLTLWGLYSISWGSQNVQLSWTQIWLYDLQRILVRSEGRCSTWYIDMVPFLFPPQEPCFLYSGKHSCLGWEECHYVNGGSAPRHFLETFISPWKC